MEALFQIIGALRRRPAVWIENFTCTVTDTICKRRAQTGLGSQLTALQVFSTRVAPVLQAEELWSVFLWRDPVSYWIMRLFERIQLRGLFCVLCSIPCISLFLKHFHTGLPLPLLEERKMESVALFLFSVFFDSTPHGFRGAKNKKMFTAAAACDSLWRGRRMTRRHWMRFDCSALVAVSEVTTPRLRSHYGWMVAIGRWSGWDGAGGMHLLVCCNPRAPSVTFTPLCVHLGHLWCCFDCKNAFKKTFWSVCQDIFSLRVVLILFFYCWPPLGFEYSGCLRSCTPPMTIQWWC